MKTERSISQIAKEIRSDWKNPYFGAVPYITAMASVESADQMYGYESAKSIVNYFLANAGTWRGEKAREIKKELNALLKRQS